MTKSLEIEAFLQADGMVIDVRTPHEFAHAHLPGAHNLPLFSEVERAEIGTLYRQAGRQAAVIRGLQLVGSRLDQIAEDLQQASATQPSSPLRLHCWRGGLRSASMAWLASTLDLPAVVLAGGYKAYRRWVLQRMDQPWPIRLLGGRTGVGKTELLWSLKDQGVAVIDLEGLANHRGSSFGGLGLPPQPSSEQFENDIAAALDALQGARQIWLEAESAQVGRCRIPAGLWRQMKAAPLLEVRRPLQTRLRLLVETYGQQNPADLVAATQRIAKRLGPQRTTAAVQAIQRGAMEEACSQMLDYYDRCYDSDVAAHKTTPVELGDLPAQEAAAQLLQQGWILQAACIQPGW